MNSRDGRSSLEFYAVRQPDYSRRYEKAWLMAGRYLNSMFARYNIKYKNVQQEQLNNFLWLRAELVRPSFDTFVFKYKNKIFSVLLEILDDEGRQIDGGNTHTRQIQVAEENNLVPCIFRMRASTLEPLSDGWNLLDSRTGEIIQPQEMGTDDLTEVSRWELQDWAVTFVVAGLRKKGFKILSYTDDPDITPQIWFENSQGQRTWVCVFPLDGKTDEKYLAPDLTMMDGYSGFSVEVKFRPLKGDKLYRGYGADINCEDLDHCLEGKI